MISISIITCTYNAASVLQRTLDSVLAQRYPNVEHIILDGMSKDDTMTLAKSYKEKSNSASNGHSIVVVSEKDNGLYDAMNKGIKMATGSYLVFLNAGDVLPKADTIDAIVAQASLEDKPSGVIYGDTDIVDDNGNFIRHRRLAPPEQLTWKSFRNGMLVCHQAFYANTTLAKANLYNLDYKYSADVDWCIRIMKDADKQHLPLRKVNAVVVNYLDGGMTIKNHRASLKERFHVMCNHYGYINTIIMHLWFVVRSLKSR